MPPPSGWAQGQVTRAKMAKNLSHLWHHPQKNETQNQIFFSLQTRRLAKSFKGLNSTLAQSTGELMELQTGAK